MTIDLDPRKINRLDTDYPENHNGAMDDIESAINTGESTASSNLTALNSSDQQLSNRLNVIENGGIPENSVVGALNINFNYDDVTKAIVAYPGAWRNQCKHLPWHDETKPQVMVGEYTSGKGQYANVAAGIAAGNPGEWFYCQADTYNYVIDGGGTTVTRIYAAGQPDMPAKIIAVASGTGADSRVILHDATQEGCPMWLEYAVIAAANTWLQTSNTTPSITVSDIHFKNGTLYIANVGTNGDGLYLIDFAKDKQHFINQYLSGTRAGGIADRHVGGTAYTSNGGTLLASNVVNSIASYTAKGAPIDSLTGEPIPKIAVGTNGGVAVIHEDGSINKITISVSDYSYCAYVGFTDDGRLFFVCSYLNLANAAYLHVVDIPISDYTSQDGSSAIAGLNGEYYRSTALGDMTFYSEPTRGSAMSWAGWHSVGPKLIIPGKTVTNIIHRNPNSPSDGLIQMIGTDFNTGMHRQSANTAVLLCDTDVSSVSDTEMNTQSDATNLSSDTDSIGNWVSANSCVLTSQTSIFETGVAALLGENNTTPAAVGLFSINIGSLYNLVNGKAYSLTYARRHVGTGGNWGSRLGAHATDSSGTTLEVATILTSEVTFETKSFEFIKGDNNGFLVFREDNVGNDGGVYIDSLSVAEVIPDYSGNENHFNVVGVLAKEQPIANSPAIAKGFGATNYSISTDAALDPEGSAYTWSFIAKCTVTGYGQYFITSGQNSTVGNHVAVLMNGTGNIRLAGSVNVTTSGVYDDGVLVPVTVVSNADNTVVSLWVDGNLIGSADFSSDTHTYADMKIGVRQDAGNYLAADSGIGMVTIEPGIERSVASIKQWHADVKAMFSGHAVTVPEEPVATSYDPKSNLLNIVSEDNIYPFSNSARLTTQASDVGVIADIASGDSGELIQAGDTGLNIYVPPENLRASNEVVADSTPRDFPFTGDSSETVFELPEGWKPLRVTVDGDLYREGSSDDYTIEFNGFIYWVEMAVAPAAVDVTIQGVRA